MRRFLIIFVSVLALLALVFLYLCQSVGLKEYILTMTAINRLDSEVVASAREYFYVADETTYRGTLAKVETGGSGVVWVWGKQGLRRFVADENTVFSFYETCSTHMLNAFKSEVGITLDDRSIYANINSWSTLVKKGDFVDVKMLRIGEKGDRVASMSEISGYDSWWPFAPIIIGDICAK